MTSRRKKRVKYAGNLPKYLMDLWDKGAEEKEIRKSQFTEDVLRHFISNTTRDEAVKIIQQRHGHRQEELREMKEAGFSSNVYGKKFSTTVPKTVRNRIEYLADSSGAAMSTVFGAALLFFSGVDPNMRIQTPTNKPHKEVPLAAPVKEDTVPDPVAETPTESWTDNIQTFFEDNTLEEESLEDLQGYLKKRITTYQSLLAGLSATGKLEKKLQQLETKVTTLEHRLSELEVLKNAVGIKKAQQKIEDIITALGGL